MIYKNQFQMIFVDMLTHQPRSLHFSTVWKSGLLSLRHQLFPPNISSNNTAFVQRWWKVTAVQDGVHEQKSEDCGSEK